MYGLVLAINLNNFFGVCSKISVNYKRYPIDNKRRYLQSLGRLLPHRIGQIFQELGFRCWIAKGQSNDVDLKLYDDKDNLLLVGEILNWSSHSELSGKRQNWIIDNLSHYNCNRLLMYTTLENESALNRFDIYDISLLKIGYQLLPKSFYDFFVRKNQVEYRRIDSRETRKHITSRLMEYLQSSGMATLVFDIHELTVTEM